MWTGLTRIMLNRRRPEVHPATAGEQVAGVPVTAVPTTVGKAEGPVAVVQAADIRAPVPTRVAATVDVPETVPMAVAREDVPDVPGAPAGRPVRPGGNVRQPLGLPGGFSGSPLFSRS